MEEKRGWQAPRWPRRTAKGAAGVSCEDPPAERGPHGRGEEQAEDEATEQGGRRCTFLHPSLI